MTGKRVWFYSVSASVFIVVILISVVVMKNTVYSETSKHDSFSYYITDEEYDDGGITYKGRTAVYYPEEEK